MPQESQQRAAAAAAAGGNNDRKEKERGGGQQRHGRHRYVATVVDRELPPGIDPGSDAEWIVDDRPEEG